LPTQDDAAVKEAARKKREEELRRRRGRQSTILTSGLGDTTVAPTESPRLRGALGG
jgi:hypothetical protein